MAIKGRLFFNFSIEFAALLGVSYLNYELYYNSTLNDIYYGTRTQKFKKLNVPVEYREFKPDEDNTSTLKGFKQLMNSIIYICNILS